MDVPGAARILVVEDDPDVRALLDAILSGEGYQVRAEPDAESALAEVERFPPDLAILDVRLPGSDGFALARQLRATTEAAVMFLTAADQIEDRLAGFNVGADDYLTKPFALPELLARVRSLLRRVGRASSGLLEAGDLVVDEDHLAVTRGGEDVAVTRTELNLLATLVRQRGRVLSKSDLLVQVWGYDAYDPNLVEVHLGTLRRKLEAHGPRIIHTVRGAGYVFRPAP